MADRKRKQVCALAYDGLCTFEFGIAVEAFALERPELDVDWYDFHVISGDRAPLSATGGFQINLTDGLEVLKQADMLIVPGWKGAEIPVPDDVIEAIRAAHERGCRVVSICSGVFVLAACGLLDGKKATTHWRYVDKLAKMYPEVQVEPDVLYVDAGDDVFTSAGSAAGLDLCLHIIQLDYGAEIANSVARRFVLPTHRQGGQAQFIERPVSKDHSSLSALLDQLRQRLDQPVTLAGMAGMANVSVRTLIRRFKNTVGMTPLEWLTNERVKLACEQLETSNARIDSIAISSGFNTPETFRHHFRRHMGVSPSRYRSSFARQRTGKPISGNYNRPS